MLEGQHILIFSVPPLQLKWHRMLNVRVCQHRGDHGIKVRGHREFWYRRERDLPSAGSLETETPAEVKVRAMMSFSECCRWIRHDQSMKTPCINCIIIIIIRPPVRSNGRTYKCSWCFYFFLSTRNLRAPSADHRETSPHDRSLCLFYKLTPKIRGAIPPKKLGAKNMQNFGRFYTTFDFDREYLGNGLRHPKKEN